MLPQDIGDVYMCQSSESSMAQTIECHQWGDRAWVTCTCAGHFDHHWLRQWLAIYGMPEYWWRVYAPVICITIGSENVLSPMARQDMCGVYMRQLSASPLAQKMACHLCDPRTLVTCLCASYLYHHWLRQWIVTYATPGHWWRVYAPVICIIIGSDKGLSPMRSQDIGDAYMRQLSASPLAQTMDCHICDPRPLVTCIWASYLYHHWPRQWIVTYATPGHWWRVYAPVFCITIGSEMACHLCDPRTWVTCICAGHLCHRWLRQWLVTYATPGHWSEPMLTYRQVDPQ